MPGKNNKNREVVIQGHQFDGVMDFLVNKYGIPKKYVKVNPVHPHACTCTVPVTSSSPTLSHPLRVGSTVGLWSSIPPVLIDHPSGIITLGWSINAGGIVSVSKSLTYRYDLRFWFGAAGDKYGQVVGLRSKYPAFSQY